MPKRKRAPTFIIVDVPVGAKSKLGRIMHTYHKSFIKQYIWMTDDMSEAQMDDIIKRAAKPVAIAWQASEFNETKASLRQVQHKAMAAEWLAYASEDEKQKLFKLCMRNLNRVKKF